MGSGNQELFKGSWKFEKIKSTRSSLGNGGGSWRDVTFTSIRPYPMQKKCQLYITSLLNMLTMSTPSSLAVIIFLSTKKELFSTHSCINTIMLYVSFVWWIQDCLKGRRMLTSTLELEKTWSMTPKMFHKNPV